MTAALSTDTLLSEADAQAVCATRVLSDLDHWLSCEPDRLPLSAKNAVLADVAAAEAKLSAIKLKLLASAGDIARAEGHRDPASWFAAHTNTDTGPARAAHRTAEALGKAPGVADALGQGRVSERHAKTILDSLEALPPVSPQLRRRAEDALIDHASRMTPKKLTELGKGILDQVDPAGEHHQLEQTLADQAAEAWAQTSVTITDRGNGISDIAAVVPTTIAARLRTYLEALTSPRQASDSGDTPVGAAGMARAERVPHSIRQGRALCTLLENIDPTSLPRHGNTATTLIVTIDQADLASALGTATLLDGDQTTISAGEARRLACNGRILPAVLGTDSLVLDLGRAARLFSEHQTIAMRLQQPTCQAEGCTIPNRWCEAHHLVPWSVGGTTNLKDGVLLCSHHHHLIHDSGYQWRRLPDGPIRIRQRI